MQEQGTVSQPGTVANSRCVIALFSWPALQAAVMLIPSIHEDSGARGGQVTHWQVARMGCQPKLTDQGLALSLAVGQTPASGSLMVAIEGLYIIRRHWGAIGESSQKKDKVRLRLFQGYSGGGWMSQERPDRFVAEGSGKGTLKSFGLLGGWPEPPEAGSRDLSHPPPARRGPHLSTASGRWGSGLPAPRQDLDNEVIAS